MCFWQVFAGIAFVWALLFRRGKGVVLIRRRSSDAEEGRAGADRGPGWRLVSSSKTGYPARSADPPAGETADAPASPSTDPAESETDPPSSGG